jgi:hypothetical protein
VLKLKKKFFLEQISTPPSRLRYTMFDFAGIGNEPRGRSSSGIIMFCRADVYVASQ